MSNDTVEIPAKWWQIVLILASSIVLALVLASVVYRLLFASM